MDLGKRQRRKVVYNEVELGRAKASDGSSSSSSGSEFEADDAADDEDEDGSGDGSGSGLVEEGADGKRVRVHSFFLLWFLSLRVINVLSRLYKWKPDSDPPGAAGNTFPFPPSYLSPRGLSV